MKYPKIILLILTLLSVGIVYSQPEYDRANQLYAEGNYKEAALLYDSLLIEKPCAELYYNLANAYFKQGEVAMSILNYERAIRLKPNFKDAKYNLEFAQQQIIDNIDDSSNFFVKQWMLRLRNAVSERIWQILSIVFFVIFLLSIFVFAFARLIMLRKFGFAIAILSLILSVLSICFTASLHDRDILKSDAIVMQGIVNAKASPDKNGTDLFTLHEGTKVNVKSTIGEWAEITVGNNKGWLKITAIERI